MRCFLGAGIGIGSGGVNFNQIVVFSSIFETKSWQARHCIPWDMFYYSTKKAVLDPTFPWCDTIACSGKKEHEDLENVTSSLFIYFCSSNRDE